MYETLLASVERADFTQCHRRLVSRDYEPSRYDCAACSRGGVFVSTLGIELMITVQPDNVEDAANE